MEPVYWQFPALLPAPRSQQHRDLRLPHSAPGGAHPTLTLGVSPAHCPSGPWLLARGELLPKVEAAPGLQRLHSPAMQWSQCHRPLPSCLLPEEVTSSKKASYC